MVETVSQKAGRQIESAEEGGESGNGENGQAEED
jgi:hypothetical protein